MKYLRYPRNRRRPYMVQLKCRQIHRTEKAALMEVTYDFHRYLWGCEVWIPLSQIVVSSQFAEDGGLYTILVYTATYESLVHQCDCK